MSHLVSAILMQAQRVAAVDPVAALDLCDRIADLAADRDDYCLVRGQCHLAVGDAAGARFWISRALALGSLDPAGLLSLGAFLCGADDRARAAAVYRTALACLPDVPALYNGLANAELERDAAAADAAASRALRLDPALPEALTNAGVLAQRRGDPDSAISLLRRALAADPALVPALINLGTVLQSRLRSEEAHDVLRWALRLAPEASAAHNVMGVVASSRGDARAAGGWLRRAVALSPAFSEALFSLGALHQEQDDIATARTIYGRAGTFRAIGLFNAGIACIRSERFEEAVSILRDAASSSPLDAGIRNQLGVALGGNRQPRAAAAAAAFRTAICLQPDVPEHQYNLGIIAHRADDGQTSTRAYLRSIRLDFHAPALSYCGIGVVRIQAGDPEGGVAALQTSLAYNPADQRTYSNLGAALQQAKRSDEALTALTRAQRCFGSAAEAVMLNLGQSYLSRREFETGAVYVRRALALKPDMPVALFCLGYSYLTRERPAESEKHFDRAVRMLPTYWLAWNNLGAALSQQGRFDEALACFRRLVTDDPDYATAHFNLAILYEKDGKPQEAEHCYRLTLQHDPSMVMAAGNLAVLLRRSGRHDEAAEVLEQALRAAPERPGAHSNLGNLHHVRGRSAEARHRYRNAIALQPDYHPAHYNLGSALLEDADPAGSRAAFRRAMLLDPRHMPSRYKLACALHQGGDPAAAIPLYREVLGSDWGDVPALNNLSLALREAGQVDEARDLMERAERLAAGQGAEAPPLGAFCRPDADRLDDVQTCMVAEEDRISGDDGELFHQSGVGSMFPAAVWNKALLQLAMGRLGAGWDGYEFRWFGATAAENRKFRQPLWDGRDLAGKRLLVWREQGIGDEIMFGSCVPDLAASNARVTIECSPKLRPLFRRSFPLAEVVTRDERPDEERDDFDVHLPIGSLSRFYRRNLADFPDTEFLVADPGRVAHWRRRLEALGPGPYVGVAWRGRLQTVSRNHHYTRIEDWEAILRTPGAVFINMQYDDASAEVARVREAFGITLHTLPDIDMWNDLDDVAALLKAQDLLISAGTAVMSLAGGLGVPTWLLWLDDVENWPCLGTDRLPWYPNVRLFMRTLRDPWTTITQRIAGELRAQLPGLGRTRAGT